MTFAQIPQQAFFDPKLKGLRFEIFAAVIMEMFLGGGVCALPPNEMCKKYPHFHYDNFCRVRKEMIGDDYLIEVDGGIIVKDLTAAESATAKIAVETPKTTAKIAVTDEKEAESLRKSQSESDSTAKNAVQAVETTAKNAVVNCEKRRNGNCKKDLDFKQNSKESKDSFEKKEKEKSVFSSGSKSPPGVSPKIHPKTEKKIVEQTSPTRAIEIFREIYPGVYFEQDQIDDFAKRLPEVEETVWRQNLLDWKFKRWNETNIPDLVKRYRRELKTWQSEQAAPPVIAGATNGTIKQFTSNHDRRSQSAVDEHAAIERLRREAEQRRAKPVLPDDARRRG